MAEVSTQLFSRLKTAVSKSRQAQESFRTNRLNRVLQYVGDNYAEDGNNKPVPLNLIELAVTTYLAHLVSSCPQVMVGTAHRELSPQAYKFELALNHLIRHEIELEGTLRRWALDAMFGIGILKIGVCAGYQVEIDGFTHDVGQPYCQNVSLDDWVHDSNATRWDKIQFCGNQYRLPLEHLRTSGLYDETALATLSASDQAPHNETGDTRAETISRGSDGKAAEDQLYPEVALWDLWLPLEGKVITCQADSAATDSLIGERPMRIVEWDGPECGPYHHLGFHDVPDQIFPLPPTAVLEELHRIVNVLYRKLGRQAERQKSNPIYSGSAEKDATTLNQLGDGEWGLVNDPKGVSEVNQGGIHQGNYAFAIDAMSRFSYMAGNLDLLAGLSAQSDTASQDKMLRESASLRMSEMQNRTMSATRKVLESLGWHLFYDPFIEIPIVKRVAGTPIEVSGHFTPEDREGDFLQYNFNIQPVSMKYQSPAEKLSAVNQLMLETLLPLQPMLAERGMQIDIEGYLRLVAKYANIQELESLVIFGESNSAQSGPVGEAPNKLSSPQTTRTYERVSRSTGGTRQGQDQAKILASLGGNEAAAQPGSMFSQAA